MESVLWAINLVAVVYLCFWAIRQDKQGQHEKNGEKSIVNETDNQA